MIFQKGENVKEFIDYKRKENKKIEKNTLMSDELKKTRRYIRCRCIPQQEYKTDVMIQNSRSDWLGANKN